MALLRPQKRDYSLISSYKTDTPLNDETFETKVEQTWWSPDIPRARLKELMQRTDGYALVDFGLWLILLAVSAYLAWISWGRWWAIPAFFVFGTIYSSSDARWHECGHGTVFRSSWLNEIFYHLSSFMTIREGYLWRWSHARHHTNTIVVGYDPEIQVERPADLLRIIMDFFNIRGGPGEIWKIVKYAFGNLDAGVRSFVPESEQPKMIWSSRIYLMIVAAFAIWAVSIGSFLPLMFVWLPRFYGGWLHQLLGLTQHAGLGEDTYDHRENTRTVYVNPVFRYLYLNMNYHLEHHVVPMVPYHRLPELHEEMKSQTPPPYKSLWQVYKEMIPALYKQATQNPDYHIVRDIPEAGKQVEAIDIPMAGRVVKAEELADNPQNLAVAQQEDQTLNEAWVVACNADDLDEEDLRSFRHNGKLYVVYRLEGDEVYASDGYCTHENVELAGGLVMDGCIECPMHNGRFNIATGKAVKAPVHQDLKMYPAKLQGGKIMVDLSRALLDLSGAQ
jgi:MocE subfamily Rieske [2Fe-2S] domain protein